MGLREFVKSAVSTLRLAAKPSRQEFMLSFKIALLGIGVVGIVAFVIRFVALALQSF